MRSVLDQLINRRLKDYLVLEVYFAGRTPTAVQAISNLEKICAEVCEPNAYQIDLINIIENPDAAEENGILATPTVIRRAPTPIRTVIGDLSDKEEVIIGLCLFST